MDRRAFLAASAAASAAVLTGCLAAGPGGGGELVVAGGEPGGTFVKLARLLATELRRRDAFEQVSVTATAGTLENLDLLTTGAVDLAPAMADAVAVARRSGVRAVAKVYQTTLHCLVDADSPVRGLADLVGRRISIGPARSGTADTAARVLRLAGVDPTDGVTRWLGQDLADGAISLAGGSVDALFWWGGRPAPEIASLGSVARFRALDLSAFVAPANLVAADVYQVARLPGEFYDQSDVGTLGVSCFLVCRRDLADDAVHRVVETVARSGSVLVPQPANGLQFFGPATLFDTAPLSLHPAAAEAYRELYG